MFWGTSLFVLFISSWQKLIKMIDCPVQLVHLHGEPCLVHADSCLISDSIPEMVGDVDTGNVVGYELLSNIFAAGGKCPPNGRANTHPVASMCAPSIVGLQSNLLNVLLLLEWTIPCIHGENKLLNSLHLAFVVSSRTRPLCGIIFLKSSSIICLWSISGVGSKSDNRIHSP